MSIATVVLGTREQAGRDHEQAICFTHRLETVVSMVSGKEADCVVICPEGRAQDEIDALSQFIHTYYPHCEVTVMKPSYSEAQATVLPADAVQPGPSSIIVVCSVKGGSGSTTLACNLAATAGLAGVPTIVLDLSQPVGDVHLHFDVEPQMTFVDCLPFIDELEPKLLKARLTDSGRISLLCGITDPRMSELVHDEQYVAIVRVASKMAQLTVVDLGCQADLASSLVRSCGNDARALIAVNPDVSSLARLRTFADECDVSSQVMLVVNKWGEAEVSEHDVRRFARQCMIGGWLPYSDEVGRSILSGKPVSISHPDSEFARAVRCVAAELLPGLIDDSSNEHEGTTILSRLWRAVRR